MGPGGWIRTSGIRELGRSRPAAVRLLAARARAIPGICPGRGERGSALRAVTDRPVTHGGEENAVRASGALSIRRQCDQVVQRPRLGLHPLQMLVSQHRSEEHTSELKSLMRISYAVFW